MRTVSFSILLPAVVLLSACAGAGNTPGPAPAQGGDTEPGSPVFNIEAIATMEDDRTGLDLYVSIPITSLVFIKQGESFHANYELSVEVTRDGESQPVYLESWPDSMVAETYEETQRPDRLIRRERVDIPAGTYTVEVDLEDGESGARAHQSRKVEIVRPGDGEAALSEILLQVRRSDEGYLPAVSLHIPAGYDSMRAVAELYNIPMRAQVRFTLLRFAADTTVAQPPYWFTPAPFTLTYMGIDYEDTDTIQVTRRLVLNASEQFTIEFDMPVLDEGTYAATVDVGEGEQATSKVRYFTVMGPAFPRITSLHEMVSALAYIARESELEVLQEAETPQELKRRFDAFWAERVPSKQAAAVLLESYYERVEHANLLFSNQKDGWKTDRGMIYVVFGPPAYVENRFTRRDWYYFEQGSLMGRRLPPFVFQRSMAYGLSGLFENYVLQRSEVYEDAWRRKVEDWRDGSIR